MKKYIKILSVCIFFINLTIPAQEIEVKDTLSGNVVTVTMDEEVNTALQELEKNCTRTTKEKYSSGRSTPKGPTRILVPSRELTQAEICRRTPKVLGFKIQLVIVKSNDEANEVKAYFRRRFSHIKVETDSSLRPNYKILAGSYFSKQSAASDLAKIRQYFPSAVPIQYGVFCNEAR